MYGPYGGYSRPPGGAMHIPTSNQKSNRIVLVRNLDDIYPVVHSGMTLRELKAATTLRLTRSIVYLYTTKPIKLFPQRVSFNEVSLSPQYSDDYYKAEPYYRHYSSYYSNYPNYFPQHHGLTRGPPFYPY